tara:strand:+ start:123 stop:449 length:327 start_codon:yes stop_codon:yes gene_type:complete
MLDKYLYFKDANNDAQMYPAKNLVGIIHDGDTTLKLRFVSAVTGPGATTEIDLVTLTITTQTEEAVCKAIVEAINGGPHNTGFIVIADALAGVFVHPDITGTAATLDS